MIDTVNAVENTRQTTHFNKLRSRESCTALHSMLLKALASLELDMLCELQIVLTMLFESLLKEARTITPSGYHQTAEPPTLLFHHPHSRSL